MPSPDLLVIAWNARICGSEVVMKELHIVWTIHDGLIRQLDNLAWTRRLGLGELVLCMFEYIWVPADDYLVFSHDAAQQPIGYLRARLSQFAQDGHVSWHFIFLFLQAVQPRRLLLCPRRFRVPFGASPWLCWSGPDMGVGEPVEVCAPGCDCGVVAGCLVRLVRERSSRKSPIASSTI